MNTLRATLPTILLAACTSANDPVKLTPAQAAAGTAHGQAPTAPPAHPAPGSQPAGQAAAAQRPAAPASAGSLQYQVPEGWIVETPTSSMRKAQFLLPKVEGDAENGQLVLFYFGGEGGSKQQNLERWGTYFTPADGSPAKPLETTTRIVNGMAVTETAAAGTLDTSMVQGMGPGKRENWRMLAAIIESPSGPYFARLLGPGATVTRWEPAFRQWIGSLKHKE